MDTALFLKRPQHEMRVQSCRRTTTLIAGISHWWPCLMLLVMHWRLIGVHVSPSF